MFERTDVLNTLLLRYDTLSVIGEIGRKRRKQNCNIFQNLMTQKKSFNLVVHKLLTPFFVLLTPF